MSNDASTMAGAEAPELRQESMSPAQAAYLRKLSDEAGEPFDNQLSSGEASRRIEQLQQKLGRDPTCILMDSQSDG